MKCLRRVSLLLFLPAANKEINKGLYSGTSSFALGADSLSPNCVVRRVRLSDCWRAQSIFPGRPLSLTDAASSQWRCGATGPARLHQTHRGRAGTAARGGAPGSTNHKLVDKLGTADWPMSCRWRRGQYSFPVCILHPHPGSWSRFNLLTSGAI